MNLDRKLIDAAIIFAVTFFMRRDIMLSLVAAVVVYLLHLLTF
jgi:hypothetical protein